MVRNSSLVFSVIVAGLVLALAGGAWAQSECGHLGDNSNTDLATVKGTCFIYGTSASSHTFRGVARNEGTKIVVSGDNKTITLNNVTINAGAMDIPIEFTSGTNKIILKGNNNLSGGIGAAAIRVPLGVTLTIEGGDANGGGTLNANGGMWRAQISAGAGAGIGGGRTDVYGWEPGVSWQDHCGTVIINSGTINAYGGSSGQGTNQGSGAGIGGNGGGRNLYGMGNPTSNTGGTDRAGGKACVLKINGGNVNAYGGAGADGIGAGTTRATGNAKGMADTTIINGGSVNASIQTGGSTITPAYIQVTYIGHGKGTNGAQAQCGTTTDTVSYDGSQAVINGVTNGKYYFCRNNNCALNANTGANERTVTFNLGVNNNNDNRLKYVVPKSPADNNNRPCFKVTVTSSSSSRDIPVVRNGNATSTKVSKTTLYIGLSNQDETQDRRVTGCQFGTAADTERITCNNAHDAEKRVYGINGVRTNSDSSRVYFWLPSYTFQETDKIALNIDGINKDYGPNTTDTTDTELSNNYYGFEGKLPSMTPPTSPTNTAIVKEHPFANVDGVRVYEGPYKTGFATRNGTDHVGAVGSNHVITLYRGKYIQNDAKEEAKGENKEERVHDVRWYRTTCTYLYGKLAIGEAGEHIKEYATALTGYPTSFSRGYISAHSEELDSVQYTPQPDDYGKCIYARVLVRDNDSRPNTLPTGNELEKYWENDNKVTVYPPIRIGVVVGTNVVIGSGFTSSDPTTGIKASVAPENQPSDSLFFTDYENDSASTTLRTSLISSLTGNISYSWKATVGINTDCPDEPTSLHYPPCVGSWTNNSVSGASYKLPPLTVTTEPTTKAPTGDITLTVTISKVSTAFKVETISFYHKDKTTLAFTVNVDEDHLAVIPPTSRIPQNGQIRLTFTASGQSATPITGYGSISLGDATIEEVDHLTYNYTDLTPGATYNLLVTGFRSTSGVVAPSPPNANFIVELPSTNTIAYKTGTGQLSEFRVGETRAATTTFVANAGVDLSKECYYWEKIEQANEPSPGTSWGVGTIPDTLIIDANVTAGVDDYKTPKQFNRIYCAPKSDTTQTKLSPPLSKDEFSKWVRLVIRSTSTGPVDGSYDGQEVVGDWMPVGILLKPVYESTTYSDIMFGPCRATTGATNTSKGCYNENGYFVSNYNEVLLRAAAQKVGDDYYGIDYWEAFKDGTASQLSSDFTINDHNPVELKVNKPITITQGTYYIKPHTEKVAPPEVVNVNIYTQRGWQPISGADVIDATINGPDGINKLDITFKSTVIQGTGAVTIRDMNNTGNTHTTLDCSITDLDAGLFQNLVCDLPMLNEGTNPFGKRYMVVVSEYWSSTNDRMGAAAYYFSTGLGPKLTVPVLVTTDLKADEYAVGSGHNINFISGSNILDSYTPEAGGARNDAGHTYTWERADEKSCSAVDIATNKCVVLSGSSLSSFIATGYTPVAADFKKYIRLAITPKDIAGKTGSTVYSDWLRIGVKATISVDSSHTLGNITAVIGSTDIIPGEKSPGVPRDDYEIIYGDTRIKVASNESEDKFKGWSTLNGTITEQPDYANSNISIATLTPSAPNGNIVLGATVRDESKPFVTVEKTGNQLIFTVTAREKEKVLPTDNFTKTLTKNTGNITITGSATDCGNATVPLSAVSFSGVNNTGFTLTIGSGPLAGFEIKSLCKYQVGITANAFEDNLGNKSEANPNMKTFTNEAIYSASLSPPYEFSNGLGISYGYTNSNMNTLTITNNDDPILLGASFEPSNGAKFNVSASPAIGTVLNNTSNKTQTFTVTPKPGLSVGRHEDVLIIATADGAIRREVKVTFVVTAKPVTTPTPTITTTKYYSGDILAMLSASGGSVIDDSVTVITTNAAGLAKDSAYYNDPNVGNNKTISVYYKIVKKSCTPTSTEDCLNKNYAFDNGTQFITITEDGVIKSPNIAITLKESVIGSKPYDGSNTLPNEKINPLQKGIDYDLSFKDELGTVLTELENPSIDIDINGALVTLVNPNAGPTPTAVQNIAGLVLKDTKNTSAENNYTYAVSGYENWKAIINPRELGVLDADGKPLGTFFGQVGGGSGNNNCTVDAKAIYGDSVNVYESWKRSLNTTCAVSYDNLVVAGNWYLCNEKSTSSLCKSKDPDNNDKYIPVSKIVTKPEPNILYAQFIPSGIASLNYDSSLIVKVNLDVEKKKINVITKDHPKKTYDRKPDVLEDVRLESKDAVGNDVLDDSKIIMDRANSKFVDITAGSGRAMVIAWNLTNDAFDKYYSVDETQAGRTSTFGTIEQRDLILLGLKGKNRYYQEKRNANGIFMGSLDAEVEAGTLSFGNIVPGDIVVATPAPNITYQFTNPNADSAKPILPNITNAYTLTGADSANYKVSLDSLYATIYPSSFGHYWCFKIEGANSPLCSHTDTSVTEGWFRDNREAVANELIKVRTKTLDSARATYGDTYSAITNGLYDVLPSRLDSVMKDSNPTERTFGSWIWARPGRVPSVGGSVHPVAYVHNNPNYSSDTIEVPLKVEPKQLHLSGLYAVPREYNPCRDNGSCSGDLEDLARKVNMGYELTGIVGNELPLGNSSVKVVGWVDTADYGVRNVTPNLRVEWNYGDERPDIGYVTLKPLYDNYKLPNEVGYYAKLDTVWNPNKYGAGQGGMDTTSIEYIKVAIGKAPYPFDPVRAITKVKAHGEENAFIYDLKYDKLSRIEFDQEVSAGWYWINTEEDLTRYNPQNLEGKDYDERSFRAEYIPPCDPEAPGGIKPCDMYLNNANYGPKEALITLKIYKRSENNALLKPADLVKPSECGAESVRYSVAAEDENATIWFNNSQYFDDENEQNKGTISISGLEYGRNDTNYTIRAQTYDMKHWKNYPIAHTRLLPFAAVAKAPQGGKALTIALDSTNREGQETRFFRKYLDKDLPADYKLDLSKTRWFKNDTLKGTGLILPVTSNSAEAVGGYSVVLYNKIDQPVIATCKQDNSMPELPDSLKYLPTINVAKNLIATPSGSRIAAGGTSLLFNTPNGGKVSIYTIKGELVSKMNAVEDRTVVKLPATKGLYIVKLEAK
jgi:hypothetical protein